MAAVTVENNPAFGLRGEVTQEHLAQSFARGDVERAVNQHHQHALMAAALFAGLLMIVALYLNRRRLFRAVDQNVVGGAAALLRGSRKAAGLAEELRQRIVVRADDENNR